MIDASVLGPLSLRVEGQLLQLGPMLRSLIVALVCAEGQTVPAATLTHRLWEDPPPGASDTVRSHIAHIRYAIGRATDPPDLQRGSWLLVTEKTSAGTGYRLRIGPGQVDSVTFGQRIRAGQTALRLDQFGAAAEHFTAALALWRGQPLADVAHLPFAQASIAHLENLHTTAVLGRIEADIWSGYPRQVIGELEALTTERPDDGAVARLLATSLYLSERLAEASLVCRQAIVGLQSHGLQADGMQELQRHVLNRTLPLRGDASHARRDVIDPVWPGSDLMAQAQLRSHWGIIASA
jgi:DNA-binding SARP family transcriptional activator